MVVVLLALVSVFLRNCIGAIDGTHVPRTPPKECRRAYRIDMVPFRTIFSQLLIFYVISYICYLDGKDQRMMRGFCVMLWITKVLSGHHKVCYSRGIRIYIHVFDISKTY